MTGNVRAMVASFFGRDAELTRVRRELLGDARLVTLRGHGGVGKTRLAHELLRILEDEFAGGVWFCDASSATSLDDLCRSVADVLRVDLHADATKQISAAIHARGAILLCLDNLEQIVDPAARAVARWLHNSPELTVLATSRSSLQIEGEVIVDVPPLSEHSAALFVDRATKVGTQISADAHALVQKIVGGLDHHPLAIELAAARTTVLTVAELADLLPGRWDLLEHARRDTPDRHRSVTATLWWSWDLLDARAKEVFARCSLFSATFDRHDAEHVCGGDALATLQTLRDASLLRAVGDAGGRRRMSMFVAMRDFGRARLVDEDIQADAHRAHAHWVLDRCENAQSTDTLGELIDDAVTVHHWGVTSDESDAIDIATRVLLAIGPYFISRGPVDAQLERWDAVLDRVAVNSARCLVERASLRRMAGRLDDAAIDLRAAASAPGHEAAAFDIALESATVHYAAGRLAEAHVAAETTTTLVAKRGGRAAGLSATLRGRVTHGLGRPAQARDLYLAALNELRDHAGERDHSAALTALGFTLQDLGDSTRAEACFKEALDAYERLGDRRAAATVTGFLGNVYRSRNERDRANACYDTAILAFQRQGAPWYEAVFRMDQAILLSALGHEAAESVFHEALTIANRTNNRRCAALVESHLGAITADRDAAEQAEQHFARAAAQLTSEHDGQFPAVLEVQRQHLVLARIRAGAVSPAAAADVRELLAAPPAIVSEHMRIAKRILERALDRTTPPDGALIVGRDGSWFQDVERVDLSGSPALGRVLTALANAEGVLDVDTLFAAAWTGERAIATARKNRVRVAVSTLRKHGLPVVFDRRAGGYVLQRRAVVV